MGIILLGAMIIGLIYCLLFNWKAIGAIIGALFAIGLCAAVGFGALMLLISALA
jgi:hypothetical protein